MSTNEKPKRKYTSTIRKVKSPEELKEYNRTEKELSNNKQRQELGDDKYKDKQRTERVNRLHKEREKIGDEEFKTKQRLAKAKQRGKIVGVDIDENGW